MLTRLRALGLLALVNGLGSSILGGQRDAATAITILQHQLDLVFGAE